MARTRFQSLLEAKINDAINNRSEELTQGSAPDYASYQHLVGHVGGLKEALSLCSEVERDMDAWAL